MKYHLQPITQREAFAFIAEHHRHHDEPEGWLFGVAVNDAERVVGVAVVGRPVARMLQNGFTAEITRVCIIDDLPKHTDHKGTEHAAPVASMLYSTAWRAARALGYIEGWSHTRSQLNQVAASRQQDGKKLAKREAGNGHDHHDHEWKRGMQDRKRFGRER